VGCRACGATTAVYEEATREWTRAAAGGGAHAAESSFTRLFLSFVTCADTIRVCDTSSHPRPSSALPSPHRRHLRPTRHPQPRWSERGGTTRTRKKKKGLCFLFLIKKRLPQCRTSCWTRSST
jgi:hypothetical protein